MKIVLTGATGFLGSHILEYLQSKPSVQVTALVRKQIEPKAAKIIKIDDIGPNTDWSKVLQGQQVVIHTAAIAHIQEGETLGQQAEYRRVNVQGTINLARQAAISGAKRFIYISSIGVNGNKNSRPFTEDDKVNPQGIYASSKWEAEKGLWDIQRETGIELVIIRPPLVYGPNAPGNFGNLIRWIERGIPLPLGAVCNKRSLVSIDNLVDLIVICIGHPSASNQVFLAGDGCDISTTELIHGIAKAMGMHLYLLPIPASILMYCSVLVGKKHVAQKLIGSLQVDISKARNLLGWEPPVSLEDGLRKCFKH